MTTRKQKPFLNKKRTHAVLTAAKVTTITGVLSLTIAGWGLLAKTDLLKNATAGQSRPTITPVTRTFNASGVTAAVNRASGGEREHEGEFDDDDEGRRITRAVAQAPTPTPTTIATPVPQTSAASAAKKFTLNVVQWTQDNAGNRIAVVQDNRGNLWLVMGTDVPRIEQGLQPQYQPQLLQQFGRSRAS